MSLQVRQRILFVLIFFPFSRVMLTPWVLYSDMLSFRVGPEVAADFSSVEERRSAPSSIGDSILQEGANKKALSTIRVEDYSIDLSLD